MGNSLLPELPEEIRAVRIGTCYNPILRGLMQRKIAIDPERLPAKEVNFISKTGEFKLRADSSTSSNARETYLAGSSKASFGNWVNLDYNMSLASAEASSSSSMNCYCSYIFKGQKLELLDMTGKSAALFNYMTDDFQQAYTELVQADPVTALAKYFEFINNFGYGCVTEMYLTSGSAIEMSVKYSSVAKANESKYHGGASAGGSWGGVSVAMDFAKKVAKTDSSAQVSIAAVNLPENSPTVNWCQSMTSTLANIGFAKLSETPGLISPPQSGNPPAPPEIPKGNPSQKDMPQGEMSDISDEMKQKLMDDDGYEGTWEEYKKAQQDMYDEMSHPKKVVAQVKRDYDKLLASFGPEQTDSCGKAGVDGPSEETSNAPGGWDMGGYIPYAFKYTPWKTLFPNLSKISIVSSFSALYLAKAYMYYISRLHFASYLSLLADMDERISENRVSKEDSNIYLKLCDNLRAAISKCVSDSGGTFKKSDYDAICAAFEKNVNDLSPGNFNSKLTYKLFFAHYDFFIDNLCGFVGAFHFYRGTHYYRYFRANSPSVSDIFDRITSTELLREGLRYYYVITPTGKQKMTGYDAVHHCWGQAWNIVGDLDSIRHTDEYGLSYYDWKCEHTEYGTPRMYGIGAATLAAMGDSPIAGLPMINPFDFDIILDFANPANNMADGESEADTVSTSDEPPTEPLPYIMAKDES